MRLSSLAFLVAEAFRGLVRHGVATLAALSTSAVSFTVFGAFLAVLFILHGISTSLLAQLGVGVYMRENTDLTDTLRVREAIRKLPGVASVEIVTRQQAWSKMRRDLGSKVPLEGVKGNPLTDELHVRMLDVDHVEPITESIRRMKGVSEVLVMHDVVRNMQSTVRVVKTVGAGAALLLLVATVSVISNMIRLTLVARSEEIRIMRLVGATDSFVRTPFVLEGAFYGLIGAAIATALVFFAVRYVLEFSRTNLPFLPLKTDVPFLPLAWALVGGGVLIGIVGSVSGLRRFLRA
jgi:cell division transport system permease protein